MYLVFKHNYLKNGDEDQGSFSTEGIIYSNESLDEVKSRLSEEVDKILESDDSKDFIVNAYPFGNINLPGVRIVKLKMADDSKTLSESHVIFNVLDSNA